MLNELSNKNEPISKETLNKVINNNEQIMKNENNELTVFIGTWNMAGIEMNPNEKFFDWFFPLKDMKNPPDIYVVGFQEIVELNAGNILINTNATAVDNYRTLITKNLNKIGE